jgi:ferric-dicitrate binding protein FerR (iron transport regulator)
MKDFDQGQKYAALIIKHMQETLSAGEKNELDEWIAASHKNKLLFQKLTDVGTLKNELFIFESISTANAWNRIKHTINPPALVSIKKSYRKWWAAAAVIFLLAGTALTYKLYWEPGKTNAPVQAANNLQIMPGGDKATLQLADGSIIFLDSTANGKVTEQGSVQVSKMNGQLSYTGSSPGPEEIVYNTIRTPRGGQYRLLLSDGSAIWLNAASSLKFPVAFGGKERKVEVTGEAYFEIAKNPSMPFKVIIPEKGEVEVLGTRFNINAYSDEEVVNTTLLEGSINVSSANGKAVQLMPGQQAKMDNSISIQNNVNTDEIIAWKTGWFNFDHTDIFSIMRQVSRWYDVDVVFQEQPGKKTFSGIVSRNNKISEVLKIMEKAGVTFRIEGKKITVFSN